ncbi:MAG: DHA2 family efflux MFS transporter permease subunit [Bauldia sp.]
MSALVNDSNRKWWTLGAVAFALFMIMLDNTVVNVALPAIQADLGIDVAELEWIVTGYALSFAVLMLSGGKLADMFGRRRIFIVGLVIFTLSSFACGFAGSAEVLIGARVIQGIGAAFMMPATLSLISAAFPPQQRGTALGIWAGVSAVALAIGPLIGGLITEHVNWNWIFYVNIPVGILAILAGLVIIRESKDTSKEQRLDIPGLLAAGVGMLALVYALIEGNRLGWGSTTIIALFAVSAVALVVFVILEAVQRVPMFDLGLFRNSTFVGANVCALLLMVAMFGVFFFLSLYMQTILGYTAIQAGASFLPMTCLVIVVAPIAGRLSDRIGPRWLMTGGMTLTAISLFIFSTLDATSNFWSFLPGTILGGIGMASTMSPMTAAALGSVPVDKAGVGSGMLNTFRQVGVSIGIALMGAIFASQETTAIAAGAGPVDAFLAGLNPAFRIAAIIALAGAAIAALTVRRLPHHQGPRGASAESVSIAA